MDDFLHRILFLSLFLYLSLSLSLLLSWRTFPFELSCSWQTSLLAAMAKLAWAARQASWIGQLAIMHLIPRMLASENVGKAAAAESSFSEPSFWRKCQQCIWTKAKRESGQMQVGITGFRINISCEDGTIIIMIEAEAHLFIVVGVATTATATAAATLIVVVVVAIESWPDSVSFRARANVT